MSYYIIDALTDEQIISAYNQCDNKISRFLEAIGQDKRRNNDSVKRMKTRLVQRGFEFHFNNRSLSDTVITNKHLKQEYHTAAKLIFGDYKTRAKSRGIEFHLNIDEFIDIVIKDCLYCGSKPSLRKRERYTIKVNGVDRLDSAIGYVKGNVVPCCGICNQMKSNHDPSDFKLHIKKIYENMKLEELRKAVN